MEQKPTRLVFRHLYDDKYGHIVKPKHRWDRPKIIMPSGFVPLLGKTYHCTIHETNYGTFVYEGKRYDLAYAHLVDKGTIIDEIDYKYSDRNKKALNPLAEALEKAMGGK